MIPGTEMCPSNHPFIQKKLLVNEARQFMTRIMEYVQPGSRYEDG